MSSNNLRPQLRPRPSSQLRIQRDTIVVSGYYGYDNLGDEAILEQLIAELVQVVPGCRIVVLSNNPEQTERLYNILSVSRWDFIALLKILMRCRLFISGGGGLFQDVRSAGSVIYYGIQILAARLFNCPVLVYAQGVGPLKSIFSRRLAKCAFKQANAVSVRDEASKKLLAGWDVRSIKIADPVWCLRPSALPEAVIDQLDRAGLSSKRHEVLRIGVSLREFVSLTQAKRESLLNTLAEALPAGSVVVPLPLQSEQDTGILEDFVRLLPKDTHTVVQLDFAKLSLPSQWLQLFTHFDFVISMRLHALIMALKAGVPVAGLAYDPKVVHLLTEFEQPFIDLMGDSAEMDNGGEAAQAKDSEWLRILKTAIGNADALALKAKAHSEDTLTLARQNLQLLATIVDTGVQ